MFANYKSNSDNNDSIEDVTKGMYLNSYEPYLDAISSDYRLWDQGAL